MRTNDGTHARSQAAFEEYYGEMPWLAVPFAERDIAQKLRKRYGASRIPCLVVLDDQGNLVTKDGRTEIAQYFG